jgi:hypothetical protein
LCPGVLVVFRAVGHAVEGQFVVDVGTEGHGDTFKEISLGKGHS